MRKLYAVLLLLLSVATAQARTSASLVSAKLDAQTLKPGETATAIIMISVNQGLHAQSHTPLGDSYIPLTLAIAQTPGLVAGEPQYPAGETVDYPQLGKLNVYIGQIDIRVPLAVTPQVASGPLAISGKIRLQACNDKSCFPPETIPFTINATITGGSTAAATEAIAATLPTTAPVPHTGQAIDHWDEFRGPTIFGLNLTRGGLPLVLVAAFVVGIIFNAMPCVLPVMPLKIMGFYEVSQHDRGKCLRLGAVFSLGLIIFFVLLATSIIAFRWIDWGGLFRSTAFTIAIVAVLLSVALSTFGVFNLLLPGSIYNLRPREDSYTGNFLFGLLTGALSTPCTFGAFVALLAWTITQPVIIGYLIFAAVGTGMAFPYFALSAFPEVARKFPRTGAWPEVVKQMTAFLIVATAVFFAQPLISRFVSNSAIWWAIFAVIVASGVFLIVRAVQISPHLRARLIATSIAALLVLPSFALVRQLTSRPYQWQAFSQSSLDAAIAAGRPVLIDFTADWCGNCHWLEAWVLHDKKVVAAVRDRDVLMLQADLTHDGAPGQELLNKLNPAGSIPFTAVYRGDVKPATLDGIYNVDDLLRLLDRR